MIRKNSLYLVDILKYLCVLVYLPTDLKSFKFNFKALFSPYCSRLLHPPRYFKNCIRRVQYERFPINIRFLIYAQYIIYILLEPKRLALQFSRILRQTVQYIIRSDSWTSMRRTVQYILVNRERQYRENCTRLNCIRRRVRVQVTKSKKIPEVRVRPRVYERARKTAPGGSRTLQSPVAAKPCLHGNIPGIGVLV